MFARTYSRKCGKPLTRDSCANCTKALNIANTQADLPHLRRPTMKLLLFSDLHCDAQAARQLIERSSSVDVLVGAGDFATARHGIDATIRVLRSTDKPAVLVPGNSESKEELIAACRDWSGVHVLHGSGVTIGGQYYFGIGGAVPVTPFGSWSYDFTEEQAAALLAECPAGCVLVSHSPPLGGVDADAGGCSLGSRSVREAILRIHPRLVVCGHIHASWGKQTNIGQTPVVNAGPMGMIWELASR